MECPWRMLMIRPSGWRIRTSRRKFNSISMWLSSNKLLWERTRSRYVYSISYLRWNADLIFPLLPNSNFALKCLLSTHTTIILFILWIAWNDSLRRRKLQRTRQRRSSNYWTRRRWKLSCSRLLSPYRKYHLERVSLYYWSLVNSWHTDPKTVRQCQRIE